MDLQATIALVGETLWAGIPVLARQMGVTLALLVVGALVYRLLTPFDDNREIRGGNVAAALVNGGGVLSLAIPLAATLAGHRASLDILVWGTVALLIQVATLFILLSRPWVRDAIRGGNVAVAVSTVGAQLAVGLVNAGAMLG